jgi:hypothetical protein
VIIRFINQKVCGTPGILFILKVCGTPGILFILKVCGTPGILFILKISPSKIKNIRLA